MSVNISMKLQVVNDIVRNAFHRSQPTRIQEFHHPHTFQIFIFYKGFISKGGSRPVDDLFASVKFTVNRMTRSLGALWAPTSSWRPFGPLNFVLHALRALRPCDPRTSDWIVC